MRADGVAENECRLFTRFLAGVEMSPYVLATYARLLPTADVSPRSAQRLIERSLLAVSHAGLIPLRAADMYARVFLPRSLLRRRLVLLLAILENTEGSERPLNSAYEGSLVSVALELMLTGIASGLCLLLGIVIFAPLHLVSGAGDAAPEPAH